MDTEDTEDKTPLTQRQSDQAHNLKVTGSKPVGGTSSYRVHHSVWTLKTRIHEDKKLVRCRGSTPLENVSA